jgi:hypothetical protein
MLETILKSGRRRTRGGNFALGDGSSSSFEALLLGFLGLRLVLNKKLEKFSCLVLIQSGGKLLDGRRNLQSLEKDLLLSLKTDIARPSHKARKITLLGTNITTNSVITRSRRKKRIGNRGRFDLNLLGGLGFRIAGWHDTHSSI